MPHPAQKDCLILQLETGDSAAEGILGPALGIGLRGIVEEVVEGCQQIWHQIWQGKFANQIGGLAYQEIIFVPKRLAQCRDP